MNKIVRANKEFVFKNLMALSSRGPSVGTLLFISSQLLAPDAVTNIISPTLSFYSILKNPLDFF